MAQYYHVLDFEGLPVNTLAALVAGLPEHSRTKARISGRSGRSLTELLLATISDSLNMLIWMQSEDGARGINRPDSIFEQLTGNSSSNEIESFDTPEEFMAERAKILARKEENA